jgi:hypothetical protein
MVKQIGGYQVALATSQFIGSPACSRTKSYPHNETFNSSTIADILKC